MGFILDQKHPVSALYAICTRGLEWKADGAKGNVLSKRHMDNRPYQVTAFDLEGHPRTVCVEIAEETGERESIVFRASMVLPKVKPFPSMVKDALTHALDRIKDLSSGAVKDQSLQMTYPQEILMEPGRLTRQINKDLTLVKDLIAGLIRSGFDIKVPGFRL